ncbi:MAG: primosomal protein N' [Defluviitaleaceae bacterium]|nr:primosomal protein N' [Defluviitaleaceae bacterium]
MKSSITQGLTAEVIVDITNAEVDKVFHYLLPDQHNIPENLRDSISPGFRCIVPFGNRHIDGCIVGFSEPTVDPSKLKKIISFYEDYPIITPHLLELAKWMKTKYYTTLAACLRSIAPSWTGAKRNKKILYAQLIEGKENTDEYIETTKKNGTQAQVLKALAKHGGEPIPIATLAATLSISASPIRTLEKKGLVTIAERLSINKPIATITYNTDNKKESVTLTEEQLNVLHTLSNSPRGKTWLLHGVTGSGKTEVYMRLIEKAITEGKQAIMLVPEIALTPQAVDSFKRRFGTGVAVTHSRLTPLERMEQWNAARSGEISIMIGPRSAVFAPFPTLGVIIVDEEHEKTYTSETTPKYSSSTVAEKLGELTGAVVVLGSATPDIITYFRAQKGEIGLLTMEKRVNNRFPQVHVADLRTELAEGNRTIFSKVLQFEMERNVKLGHQTILFMNRRGHSTFVSCRACGYVCKCGSCSVNFTYHTQTSSMLCHYCGARERPPTDCPQCSSRHVRYFGVGTQKIEEEVTHLFPGTSVARMDMDTTSTKSGHEKIIRRFAEGKAQILVGTQMIAKGLDFPNVSLVGIIDADVALNMGDYRSAETAFQLITQVSGRAGRASLPGKVIIQTYMPHHYSIEYSKDNNYAGFYSHEIISRQTMGYPPFGHIFMVMMTCEDEKKLISVQKELAHIMRMYNRKGFFDILGPSPAIVSKVNNLYRWKILVKTMSTDVPEDLIIKFVFYCVDKLKAGQIRLDGININLTLDPKSLL